VSKVPGADLDAKNSPRAGIECVLLTEPARHEGRLDEEPENLLRRRGNENLAFDIITAFIAASTSELFVLPPVSTAIIHHPRTPQAQLADWQRPID